MKKLPDLLLHLAESFEFYLTLERVHPTRTYDYAARGFYGLPVIEVTRHAPKCKQGESWMYIATTAGAKLHSLSQDERLYVGAQTQDRMFRGDNLNGNNYHHAEMRAGRGGDDPVTYLRSGRRIEIQRVEAEAIRSYVSSTSALSVLKPLLSQPTTAKKHLGWWFEQYILYSEHGQWRWNTAPADKSVVCALGGRAYDA